MSGLRAAAVGWHAGKRRILGPATLEVSRGECLAVVGPNGAGKTTLMRLLAGVLEPSGGELFWEGIPFRKHSRKALARRISYVPQSRPQAVPLTVAQMVLLGRYPWLSPLRAAPREEDFAAVREAVEEVGLVGLEQRRMEQLSGGERQSVYIAAALAQEADLLLLDEPTTHLDPRHQREVAGLLRRLHRQGGRTIIAATHDLNFASLVAGRVVALKEGSILACAEPSAIFVPEVLAELFEAPFEIVRGGSRPVTLLELDT